MRSSAISLSALGKMMEDIRHGKTPNEAYEKNGHLRPLQQ